MKVTIEHGGKKVDVELTAEQVKELGLQEEKKTGWERAKRNEIYYYINDDMDMKEDVELKVLTDIHRYDFGNYFTDKTLAKKMLKRVRLMLKMQRWADEHNEPLDWNDSSMDKYCISYDFLTKNLYVYRNTTTKLLGAIYFSSDKIAKQAVEIFGNEIIDCYVESEVTR